MHPIIACPNCSQRYTLTPTLAGKTVVCKKCNHAFQVPAVATSPAVAGAQPSADLGPLGALADDVISTSPVPLGMQPAGPLAMGGEPLPVAPVPAGQPAARRPRKRAGQGPLNEEEKKVLGFASSALILGYGCLILPIFGLQFRRLEALGSGAAYLGIVASLLGAGLLAYALRRRGLVGLASGGGALLALLILCFLSPDLRSSGPPDGRDRRAGGPSPPVPPPPVAPPRPTSPIGTAPIGSPPGPSSPGPSSPGPLPPDRSPNPTAAPAVASEPLGTPAVALAKLAAAPDDCLRTKPMGNNRETFGEMAPEGGVLVGFNITEAPAFGTVVGTIQPIYQVEKQYTLGTRYGKPQGREIRVLAKPGYAVAGINGRAGLLIDGMEVVFARIDGHRFDRNDTYASAWIGKRSGGNQMSLDCGDRPAIGVFGSADRELRGIGLVFVSGRP